MQFTRTAVLVALAALVAVAVASPVENSNVLSAAGLETRAASTVAQVAAVQQHASTDYQRLHSELTKLDADSVSIEQLRPVVDRITATTKSAADELNKLSEQAKNEKRQDLLAPAINQLVVDLNVVLKDLRPLVKHLTSNLELGTVQNLLNGLTPALTTLVAGVEALLTSLAPGLSSLLDPLLHTVYALTAGLGLNLNLPSA